MLKINRERDPRIGKLKKWWIGRSGALFRFSLPGLFLMSALIVVPLVYSIFLSFQSLNLATQPEGIFIGLRNYKDILSDKEALQSIWQTMYYVILAIPSEMIVGFCIALLLSEELKGFHIVRALFLLPLMITPVVTGLLWSSLMFHNELGLVRYFLDIVGIEEPPIWLGDPKIAMLSIVLVDFWQNVPFVTIALLAGLQGILPSMIEAAEIDGASYIQKIRYVITPVLWPVILVVVFIRLVSVLKVFGYIFVLTRGGPGGITTTMVYYIYKWGINMLDFGHASAMSVLALLFSATVTAYLINYMFKFR